MKDSLAHWEKEKIRSIQFYIKPPKCHLMNILVKHDFYFHHASTKDSYVLMCKWTDPSTENRIPPYGSHFLGTGGVVFNDKDEILLI